MKSSTPPTSAATSDHEIKQTTPSLPLSSLPTTQRPMMTAPAPTTNTPSTSITTTTTNKRTHPTIDQPWYFKQITPGAVPGPAPAPASVLKSSTQNPSPNSALNLVTSQQQQQQQQHQGILYPVASSGRGFIAKPKFDPPGAPRSYPHHQLVRPYGYGLHNSEMRPSYYHPSQSQSQPPVPIKVAYSSSTVSDSNGITDSRERSRDETFAMVKDRKVRISDSASLYALCRSWLRNGFHEETQLRHGGGTSSLPRPPPPLMPQTLLSMGKDSEKKDGEDNESVEHLSTQDLLQRHIRRAKKVRSRLREERLRRIARYKTRLATLLPPQVEQFRDETASGN